MHQHVGLLPRNPGDRRQRFHRLGHLLLEPFGHHHLRLDVHLPAGQLGGQPRVLAPLADGQRKLVLADRDFDPLAGFIHLEGLELGRGQRVGDEVLDVRVPADDVHLLVVQFPHDVLDPLAAQAHAGAHRVHLLVAGPDRQLGPETRLPGDALDFNRAVVDFRHLELEQLDDKVRVGAGQDDFRAVRAFLDRLDVAADPLAHLVFLGRHALAVGQQGLVLAQVHDHVRPVEAPHRAADDVAHPVLELGEDQLLLRAPDVLHQGLLGVLGGDAAEAHRRHFHLDLLAQLGVRLDPPGIEHRNLVVLGNDLLRHHQLGKGTDVAVLLVNDHAQFARRPDRLLGGGQQGLLHRGGQDITVDALFPLPEFQDC